MDSLEQLSLLCPLLWVGAAGGIVMAKSAITSPAAIGEREYLVFFFIIDPLSGRASFR
jgi:hypothetical protein